MSESDARLKVTADTTGAVGPVDDLTAAQQRAGDAGKKASDDLGASYAKAAASVDKFGAQVEAGGKGAERGLALATIQVQKLEAEIAQLRAQGKPTAALEAGLDSLKGKLAASTAQLGQFRAAAADAADATRKATQRAGEFSGSVTDVTGTLKTLSPALGNAIDKYSILAAKGFVLVQALKGAAVAAKELAIANGEYNGSTKDAIDSANGFASALLSFDFPGAAKQAGIFAGSIAVVATNADSATTSLGNLADAADAKNFSGVLKLQRDLVQGHEEEVAALDKKSEALVREIATQKAAGEVQQFVRDEVQKTIDGYVAAGEPVDAALATQAASLGIVATAQKQAATGAQALSDTTVTSAEARATAEEAASARTVAALETENAKRQQAVDTAQAALEQTQKATDAAEAGQFDSGAGATNAEAEKLKATIKELNALPTQTPDQVAQLDAARESLADLNLSIRKYNIGLGESGTIAGQVSAADAELNAQRDLGIALLEQSQSLHDQAIDRLEQEEGGYGRLSASMQEFVDVGLKAGDGLQGTFSDAGEAATETGDAVQLLSEQAGTAADEIGKAADAATTFGDQTKKGAEAATEGIGGAAEAVATLKTTLEACEVVIDRIGTKLANLQLGS